MASHPDLAVHSFAPALRFPRLPRKFRALTACRTADFAAVRRAYAKVRAASHERSSHQRGRQCRAGLCRHRRRHAAPDDGSRLADELDGSLVKTRRLERTNREVSEKLDVAIGTIRAVLDAGEDE